MRIHSVLITGILCCISVATVAQNLITTYSVEEGLPQSTVTDLYRDNDGYLWVGTTGGLAFFDGWEFHRPVSTAEKNTPALNIPIHGIIGATDQKTVWVGTDSVLMQFDRYSMRLLRSFDVVKLNGVIESPVFVNDTAVWVACAEVGLFRVRLSDGKAVQLSASGCYPGTEAVVRGGSMVCIVDSTEHLIFTDIADGKTFSVPLNTNLNGVRINAVVELPGTSESVLLLTASGIWQCDYTVAVCFRYNLKSEYKNDSAFNFCAMAVHPDGTWWLAIKDKGVYEYDPVEHSMDFCYGQFDNGSFIFPSRQPAALICDQYGVTWCATQDGLLKMNHGRFMQHSAVVSGYLSFRAPTVLAAYGNNQQAAGIVMTSIERVSGSDPLELNIWQTDFAFPERVKFEYRLEGTVEKLADTLGLRSVMYDDLQPGFYSFLCSVTVPGSASTPTAKLVTIKVIAPYWQSASFIGITCVSVLLIVTLILFIVMRMNYQRKLRKLRMQQELDKVRARISRDIHDDIGAGLTRIALSGELMSAKADVDAQQQEKLKWIAATARELSQSMKEVVWSVNPHYDSLDHMAAYFRSYVAGVAENADVRFRYVADENLPALEVNPETRRNFLLILKESVSNSVKYSGCKELRLEIRWNGTAITMTISDDGAGFDLDSGEKVNSNGIRNIRQRAEASGCTIRFFSEKGMGTSIEVKGPVNSKE